MWSQADEPKTSTNLIIKALSLHQRKLKNQNSKLQELVNNANDLVAPIDPYSIQCLVTNQQISSRNRALAAKIRIKHLYGDSTFHRISSENTPSAICKLCNTGPPAETQGHILALVSS